MIRFAVWAAVSTLVQVEGASLEDQIEKCQTRGKGEGWFDTGLVYVADGYSRTGYVNLSDAERDIPPLAKMLADMRGGLFDVLVLFNYDRLGDLILMIATEFRNQKRQLFSLSQPTPIQEKYNPYMDDSSFIMQSLAPIWQKQRIADLRRKWEVGIPKRIRDGLHPGGQVPFGYRKTKDGEPFEMVRSEASAVKDMAKMLLDGNSLRAIAKHLNDAEVKTPHGKQWSSGMVAALLRNPFYYGVVQWRKDSRMNGRRIQNPENMRVKGEGKHEAIFTQEQFDAIQAELRRRAEKNRKNNIKYPFTGLLYCGHCGGKLYRTGKEPYFYIAERGKACQSNHYEKLVKVIADEIQKQSMKRKRPSENVTLEKTDFTLEIKDIEERIARVQQSAELGVYTPLQAAKRVGELHKELEKIEAKKYDADRVERAQKDFDESFEDLEDMAEWILSDDAPVVNSLLHSVINKIIISRGYKVQIQWR